MQTSASALLSGHRDASGRPVDPKLIEGFETSGGPNAPESRKLKDEMQEHFDPKTEDADAAAELVRQEIAKFQVAEAGVKTSRMASLSMAIAEFAYYEVLEDRIVCDANAWSKLRDRVREVSGDASRDGVVAVDDEGAEIRKSVITATVFDGIAPQYIKGACQRAMLFAIGHLSGVCVGYLKRTKASARFDKLTEWARWEELDADEREDAAKVERTHYIALCVPWNVVHPWNYGVKQNASNKLVLVPKDGDKTAALHYLADDWSDALYLNKFASRGLEFEMEQKGTRFPSGLLIGASKAKRNVAGAQAAAKAPELTVAIARMAKGGDTLAGRLHSCAAVIVTQPPNLWGCPENEVRQGAFICARAGLGSLNNKQTPKGQEAAELIDLLQDMLRHVEVSTEDGDLRFYWVDPETRERIGEMSPSQKPMQLSGLGALLAGLQKAEREEAGAAILAEQGKAPDKPEPQSDAAD